ncbi:MAG: sulfatase-like hydrolase/transferase [Armatimonadota bacterium]
MTRRQFLAKTGGALLGTAAVQAMELPSRAQGEDLNILFLMTDQQHHRTLGCAGNELIRTPHLDRLAAEGVRFTQAFCPTPFCSPTRVSVITGLYPHRHGQNTNTKGREHAVRSDWVTTEDMLFDRGLATAHRGKWHIGPKADFRAYRGDEAGRGYVTGYGMFQEKHCPAADYPKREGETRAWGRPVEMTDAIVAGRKIWHTLDRRPQQDLSIIGRSVIPPEGLPESLIAEQTIGLLEKHRDRNFMITCSWSPPHALWVTTEPYYSMYDPAAMPLPDNFDICPEFYHKSAAWRLGNCIGPEGIREYLRCYYGQVSFIDWNVGRILKRLEELGLAHKTLVLFTSDHGDMQGAHRCVGKSVPGFYDAIARVPLLMRLPGRIEPGAVRETPVNLVDVMPTLLDYAGVPAPGGIDGRNLRPLIEGRVQEDPNGPAFCERTAMAPGGWIMRMIWQGEWKYVFRSTAFDELYNMVDDPGENVNLVEERKYRAVVREMHRRLRDHLARTKEPRLDQVPKDPFA